MITQPEENRGYIEGDEPTHKRILQRHRSVAQGMLWILQNDTEVPEHHADSIAVGEFPIDSFAVRKRQPDDTLVLEGYLGMLDCITHPCHEIPYRTMIPETARVAAHLAI